LTETKKRKPEEQSFDHSVPIIFADGQAWFVPRPWRTLQPHFENGRVRSISETVSYAPHIDELVEAIATADDPEAIMCGVASLAAVLLGHHYALTDAELDQLLALRPTVPDPRYDWPKEVMRVVSCERQ
jgi:hypothetical protein